MFDELLDPGDSSGAVWADSACRSAEREASLAEANHWSRIHRKGARERPLNARGKGANRKRSKVRVRVEHVFAQQPNHLVRTVGKVRAEVRIVLMNIVCNMRRLAWLAG